MHDIIALLGGEKVCTIETCGTENWPLFIPPPYDASKEGPGRSSRQLLSAM